MTTAILLLLASTFVTSTSAIFNIQTLLQLPNPPTTKDTTPESSHAPWSYPPHCLILPSTLPSHPSPKTYCIYTSNTSSPYSQSYITTPSKIALVLPNLQTSPLHSFLTSTQAETFISEPAPWKVVDIPGKGKGVVATRRIKRFETVMIDQAALIVDLDVERDLVVGEGREEIGEGEGVKMYRQLLKVAVGRLRGRDVVRGMSGEHASSTEDGGENGKGKRKVSEGEDDESGKFEHDILQTNAFGSTVAGWGAHTLFPLVSRINHACDPNSYVLFLRAGVSMAVRASRDIEKGEEITISYLPLGLPTSSRTPLIARWGFTCTCTLCSSPPSEAKLHDTRRTLISASESRILSLAASYALPSAIALALETISLIKDEGLESQLTDVYTMLAMLYLEQKELQLAEAYGEMAWGVLERFGFLGVEGQTGVFSLRELMGRIEGMGGVGKGWKRKSGGV